MAKRKADIVGITEVSPPAASKKAKHEAFGKSSLMHDSDSSSDESEGGARLDEPSFKINEKYAKKFEHNKKREELQRLEEKYQKIVKPAPGQYGDKYDEDSESSNDEDEDDDGVLATEALDAEIFATLQAIRAKDPRVYNEKIAFYAPIEEGDEVVGELKKERPVYLRDYHRENLLSGHTGAEEEEELAPKTFAQEQEESRNKLVREMHAAVEDDSEKDDGEGTEFLVPKTKYQASEGEVHPSRKENVKINIDPATAEKDPESFLSNFMAARAWVPDTSARFQPLESDDEDEDERAEIFEAAYNLRFEDPKGSNEMLKSYARDVVAAKSVRREEPSGRKRQREADREKKDAEKREINEEKTQLRRLKIEEMEEKLQKIKKAAGIRGRALESNDWAKFLDKNWDDDNWESEMNTKFGAEYYAEQELESEGSDIGNGETSSKKKNKIKKPKWDDDIDIKDLIPDFVDNKDEKPSFDLSDSDAASDEAFTKSKSSKDRQHERQAKKKALRLERQKIEELVDNQLDLSLPSKKQQTLFRYRETSPISFGLTARDILMAPDTSLNQFAGLKKMAAFRDPEKKRKDKRHLGKKSRLRQWRKETFGSEEGPEISVGTVEPEVEGIQDSTDIIVGGRKKRSRKSKGAKSVEV